MCVIPINNKQDNSVSLKTMKKHTISLLLLIAPITLLASVRDSLSRADAPLVNVLNDSNGAAGPFVIDTVVSVDTALQIGEIGPLENYAVCVSHELVHFELNKLPVTEEMFTYHTSTRNFEVPMEYNTLVKTQIDYFGTRWQPKLKEMLSKSKYFFPLYEQILSENDMPLEIKYLSIIESGLNPFAGSRVGAVGAWQFMPATGKMFDLEISSIVDERRSLEKSTRAACKYLKQMHSQYGDWLVALASYNCGPGNVRKAMRRSGRKDFWGMYSYLPRETQNYVPKFIAMTYMMNFHDAFGITPAPIADSLYRMEQVFCEEDLDFETIAAKIGVNKERLLKCNPEMKTTEIPFDGKGYVLFVPEGTSHLFYEHQQDIQRISVIRKEEKRIAEANRPKVVYHYVRRGESLILIARRHGVTVNQLKMWNGIRGSTIYAKQRLKINRS